MQNLLLTCLMKRYNYLLDDHDQPHFSEHHLNQLARIFVQYNVQKIFDLHLIHGHLKIPHNTFMLSSSFKDRLSDYWIKPTPFEAMNSNPIHEHIYTLSPNNRLLAYEYREDDAPKCAADINQAFFEKLFKYLSSNQLTELLGLKVLENTSSSQSQMLKFVLAEEETVMIKKEKVAFANIFRVTEWSFIQNENEIVSIKEHETHATANEIHQIFRDEKPLRNIDEMMNFLLQKEMIKHSRWMILSN